MADEQTQVAGLGDEALGRALWQRLQDAGLLSETCRGGWERAPKEYQDKFTDLALAAVTPVALALETSRGALGEALTAMEEEACFVDHERLTKAIARVERELGRRLPAAVQAAVEAHDAGAGGADRGGWRD